MDKVFDSIQMVEKAVLDIRAWDHQGPIKNPIGIKSIEGKLPENVKKDWIVFMVNPNNDVTWDNHSDGL